MDKWEGSQLNTAKEILAYELTKLVHGEEEAEKAQAAAKALFSSGNAANMPTYELTEDDFNGDEIDILSICRNPVWLRPVPRQEEMSSRAAYL